MLLDFVDLKSTWFQAFSACFLISLLPNLLLFIIPSYLLQNDANKKRQINVQNIFLYFASGGLLGDVFLHIIPHMLTEHNHAAHSTKSVSHNHLDHHTHNHETVSHDHHRRRLQHDHEHNHVHHNHDHHHAHDHHNSHDQSFLKVDHNDHTHHHTEDKTCSNNTISSVTGAFHVATTQIQSFWLENRGLCIGLIIIFGFMVFVAIDRYARVYATHSHHNHSHNTLEKNVTAVPLKADSTTTTTTRKTRATKKDKTEPATNKSESQQEVSKEKQGSYILSFPIVLLKLLNETYIQDGIFQYQPY